MPSAQARLALYIGLFHHWSTMLGGRSYWHAPQGLGQAYLPSELAGYHNDLSAKTLWKGASDAQGLPLNTNLKRERLYFPIALFQKGLGHWDVRLEGGGVHHETSFLAVAHWAVGNQDPHGGWPTWPQLGLEYASPYSAMAQGQGISVLVRAQRLTGDETYGEAARRALAPLLLPVSEGGTARYLAEGLVLEESPEHDASTVLNGWIFALYGLHDYLLVYEDRDVREALDLTLRALTSFLPSFDADFWSYYDLCGSLASPFYHALHIAQLRALEATFPEHGTAFGARRRAFEAQSRSRVNRTRALMVKAGQKLRRPPPVVLR